MLDIVLLAAVTSFPTYGSPAPQAVVTQAVEGVPAYIDLSDAVELACAKSPILAVARATYDLANLDVAAARTSELPSVSLQGAYSSGNAIAGPYGGAVESTAFVNFQQLLYDGGRVAAQIRSARYNAGSADHLYRRQLQTLAYNVAQSYYTELQADSQVLLEGEIVRQDLEQEHLIVAQIKAGTAAPVDLQTAQIPTTQGRLALVRAQGTQLAALAAFTTNLGLPANAAVQPSNNSSQVIASALPAGTPFDYDAAVRRALALRPDYLAAIAQVEVARQNLRVRRLQHSPSVSLVSYGGYEAFGSVSTPMLPVDSIGASISVPIFDQGLTNIETSQASVQLEQTKAELDAQRLSVLSDVRQSLVQLISAQSALQQSNEELVMASAVLKSTRIQYSAGQTSLPLLLNAQTQLATAENDKLESIYTVRQAEQTYLYALGENDSALILAKGWKL